MNKETLIFCDVDGCLADLADLVSEYLDYRVENSMGNPKPIEEALINYIAEEADLERSKVRINDHPKLIAKFWSEIPWISNGKSLWRALLKTGCDLKIITALPSETKTTNFPGTEMGKRIWCKRLGLDQKLIHVVPTRTKGNYVDPDRKCILIDDHQNNIEDWKKAGGIGIWHQNDSLQNTLDQLLYHL